MIIIIHAYYFLSQVNNLESDFEDVFSFYLLTTV